MRLLLLLRGSVLLVQGWGERGGEGRGEGACLRWGGFGSARVQVVGVVGVVEVVGVVGMVEWLGESGE